MFFGIVVFKEGPPYVTKQRNVLLMISLSALAEGLARAEEVRTGSFADSLARMFSSEVRNADARLVTLRNELADLQNRDAKARRVVDTTIMTGS